MDTEEAHMWSYKDVRYLIICLQATKKKDKFVPGLQVQQKL